MLRTHPTLWLPPLEGITRDEHHRYRLGAHQFPVSVTGVLQATKSAYAMARIEETRADWEPRGNTCHKALELAASSPDWHPDHWPACWPWIDWIWPMLTHPLWDDALLIASERPLYSLTRNIAGTTDGALLVPKPGRGWWRYLFDLKSQGTAAASPYDTRAQLGGYLEMELEHGNAYDGAFTLWARPGRCRLSRVCTVEECLVEWRGALAAYGKVQANQERARAAGVIVSGSVDPFRL